MYCSQYAQDYTACTELDLFVEMLFTPSLLVVNTITTLQSLA